MISQILNRMILAVGLIAAAAMFYGAAHDPWAFAQTIGPAPGGGAATCGSAANGVCFNNAGAFASDSGLTYAGGGAGLTETYTGSTNQQLFQFVATGLAGSPGLTYTAQAGLSKLVIGQGNSGGGLDIRDFNDQSLLVIGNNGNGFQGYWTIQGTGNTSLGDLGPGTDNANNIGGASNRVKTIFAATAQVNAVSAAGSPPTLSGTCTTGTQTGGNTAGTFLATCVSQTVIMTFGFTAANGWACNAHDLSTPTDALNQTNSSTTSCTLTGTTVASDKISFNAIAF